MLITESRKGRAFEIDSNGKIVWEYFNNLDEDAVFNVLNSKSDTKSARARRRQSGHRRTVQQLAAQVPLRVHESPGAVAGAERTRPNDLPSGSRTFGAVLRRGLNI